MLNVDVDQEMDCLWRQTNPLTAGLETHGDRHLLLSRVDLLLDFDRHAQFERVGVILNFESEPAIHAPDRVATRRRPRRVNDLVVIDLELQLCRPIGMLFEPIDTPTIEYLPGELDGRPLPGS